MRAKVEIEIKATCMTCIHAKLSEDGVFGTCTREKQEFIVDDMYDSCFYWSFDKCDDHRLGFIVYSEPKVLSVCKAKKELK